MYNFVLLLNCIELHWQVFLLFCPSHICQRGQYSCWNNTNIPIIITVCISPSAGWFTDQKSILLVFFLSVKESFANMRKLHTFIILQTETWAWEQFVTPLCLMHQKLLSKKDVTMLQNVWKSCREWSVFKCWTNRLECCICALKRIYFSQAFIFL